MRFRELSRGWKILIIVEAILALALCAVLGGTIGYVENFRAQNAAIRAAAQKTAEERIGERVILERDGAAPVELNTYWPTVGTADAEGFETASGDQTVGDSANADPLPVLVNIHGGGFIHGDADEMDSQAQHWANDWGMLVISVNYTKLDVKPLDYGVEEIVDAVTHVVSHASDFDADPDRVFLIGHSAGAHYATLAVRHLVNDGIDIAGQVLMVPSGKGLPTEVEAPMPPTFVQLAEFDPISQGSRDYVAALEASGTDVTVVEYPGTFHPFVLTPYPEVAKGMDEIGRIMYITEEQQEAARQAEADIGQWLAER